MPNQDKLAALEDCDGVLYGQAGRFGIIKNPATRNSIRLINATDLVDAEPFLTVANIPLEALKEHKIHEEKNESQHAVKIGTAFYDSVYLAEVLEIIGNSNVEFYQKGKDNPLGIKTAEYNAVLAPVLIGYGIETTLERYKAEQEIATIPELSIVIDNYLVNKKPRATARFSLRDYAASK